MGKAKAKIKSSPEAEEIINMIGGAEKKKVHHNKGLSKVPEAQPRKVDKKPRESLAKAKESFKQLCDDWFMNKSIIADLQETQDHIKERAAIYCKFFGVTVRETDKAFYSHPYKAQVENKRQSGSIEAEPLLEWAAKNNQPELVMKDKECTLDVVKIQAHLMNDKSIHDSVRGQLLMALDQIIGIARNAPNDIIRESDNSFLNLEKYDELKRAGKIPMALIEEAEQEVKFKITVSIDEITGKDNHRCSGCSEKLPKHAPEGYECPRCHTKN